MTAQPAAMIDQAELIPTGTQFDEGKLTRFLECKNVEFRGPVSAEKFQGDRPNPAFLLLATRMQTAAKSGEIIC